jgi:hypothetical protein
MTSHPAEEHQVIGRVYLMASGLLAGADIPTSQALRLAVMIVEVVRSLEKLQNERYQHHRLCD